MCSIPRQGSPGFYSPDCEKLSSIAARLLGFRQVLGLHLLLNVPSLRNEAVEVEIIHLIRADAYTLVMAVRSRYLQAQGKHLL